MGLKQKQDQAKDAEKTEQAERRRLTNIKLASPFKVAAPNLVRIRSVEEGKCKDNKDWYTPFFTTSEKFKPIFEMQPEKTDKSANAVLHRTMVRWSSSFPNSDEAATVDKVIAPLLQSMGLSSALEIFHCLADKRVVARLPSYSAIEGKCTLFGAMKDAVHFGCEPNWLACLRVQHEGSCDMLAMAATDAAKLVEEIRGKKGGPAEAVYDALSDLTDEEATKCKTAGINIYNIVLEPNMVFYLPPGFVSALRVRSQSGACKNSSAIKFHFLPQTQLADGKKTLECLVKLKPPAKELHVLHMLIDVLTVAASAADLD